MIFAFLIYGGVGVWVAMNLSDRLKKAETRVEEAQRELFELRPRLLELEAELYALRSTSSRTDTP